MWVPINDDPNGHYIGFHSAALSFCYHLTHSVDVNATQIGPGQQCGATVTGGLYKTLSITPVMIECKLRTLSANACGIVN